MENNSKSFGVRVDPAKIYYLEDLGVQSRVQLLDHRTQSLDPDLDHPDGYLEVFRVRVLEVLFGSDPEYFPGREVELSRGIIDPKLGTHYHCSWSLQEEGVKEN